MATFEVSLVAIAQTLAIFAFLVVTLRLIGRRTMAQLTIIGFLIVALLGSAVESGLYAGSSALPAGLSSAAALLLADRGLAWLIQKSSSLRKLLIGSPIVLVHDGQIVRDEMRRGRMTIEDVMHALRIHGYRDLDEVKYAFMEVDGSITVIQRD